MTNYARDQQKITIYYDGDDYHDVPSLALRAVKYLAHHGKEEALLTYGGRLDLYVKQNKHGVTVRQLSNENT